jgi:hypothetical protein
MALHLVYQNGVNSHPQRGEGASQNFLSFDPLRLLHFPPTLSVLFLFSLHFVPLCL